MCVCVCVCACVRAWVRACVRACVCACVCVCVCVSKAVRCVQDSGCLLLFICMNFSRTDFMCVVYSLRKCVSVGVCIYV